MRLCLVYSSSTERSAALCAVFRAACLLDRAANSANTGRPGTQYHAFPENRQADGSEAHTREKKSACGEPQALQASRVVR
jgi:hypothetical protein